MDTGTKPIKAAYDVVVVGGGIAGIVAAAYAARAGRSVLLLEGAKRLGGRAATRDRDGILFNLGAHALYRTGEGAKVLAELGVPIEGGVPGGAGAFFWRKGRAYRLPAGAVGLLASPAFGWRDKARLMRFLGGLGRIETGALSRLSVSDWLEGRFPDGPARDFVAALIRLGTYCAENERQSAGAALEQVRLAITGGVWYLDGGWQSLVAGLRRAAESAMVQVATGWPARAARESGHGVLVEGSDGQTIRAKTVILAVAPDVATGLLGEAARPLANWARRAAPARAATLDVALRGLPDPRVKFLLDLDSSRYFSVHSAHAKLAPVGIEVVHVMKYLTGIEVPRAEGVLAELEDYLDIAQPGWRERAIERRFLPHLTVTHASVQARDGGTTGRPGPALAGTRRLFLAGDWVGPTGMLADAALASARAAAKLAASVSADARDPQSPLVRAR